MPTRAISHIHTSAPGPPEWIAVATPTMLPVPMVADSEVASAAPAPMVPTPVAGATICRKPKPSRRIGRNVRRMVR